MDNISMSYVLATRNKLPYLKNVMTGLLANVQEDEEIIITDGASEDGTVEYLQKLKSENKNLRYVSEPDFCQAHGYNKALLMARGKIIKILTDDDVFYFPGIRDCKKFMLSNPKIDMLAGNIADARVSSRQKYNVRIKAQEQFLSWLHNNGSPFWFGDQGIFIRRCQLPLIGLWNTGVACIDVELSVRTTALRQARLAWYTGVISCSILNPNSLTFKKGHDKDNSRDLWKVFRFYVPRKPLYYSYRELRSKLSFIKKPIRKSLTTLGILPGSNATIMEKRKESQDIEENYRNATDWLHLYNEGKQPTFLYVDSTDG